MEENTYFSIKSSKFLITHLKDELFCSMRKKYYDSIIFATTANFAQETTVRGELFCLDSNKDLFIFFRFSSEPELNIRVI